MANNTEDQTRRLLNIIYILFKPHKLHSHLTPHHTNTTFEPAPSLSFTFLASHQELSCRKFSPDNEASTIKQHKQHASRSRELRPNQAMVVRSSLGSWVSFHICGLTLLLAEVTLRVLGAGDLCVTGVTPLLRLLFRVAGPASWS